MLLAHDWSATVLSNPDWQVLAQLDQLQCCLLNRSAAILLAQLDQLLQSSSKWFAMSFGFTIWKTMPTTLFAFWIPTSMFTTTIMHMYDFPTFAWSFVFQKISYLFGRAALESCTRLCTWYLLAYTIGSLKVVMVWNLNWQAKARTNLKIWGSWLRSRHFW